MKKTAIISKASNMEKLKELLKGKLLTGYIWMIDEKKPYVYDKKIIDFDKLYDKENPYNKIQEAYLTDDEHSIYIKNIDGEEKVFVFSYQDFEKENYLIEEEKKYPSHVNNLSDSHFSRIKKLHFHKVYKLTENEINKGFKTWQPVVKLFTGLTLKTNKKTN